MISSPLHAIPARAALLVLLFAAAAQAHGDSPEAELLWYARRQLAVATRVAVPPLGRLEALGFAQDTVEQLLEEAGASGVDAEALRPVLEEMDRVHTAAVAPELAAAGIGLEPALGGAAGRAPLPGGASGLSDGAGAAGLAVGSHVWALPRADAPALRVAALGDESVEAAPTGFRLGRAALFERLGGGVAGGLLRKLPGPAGYWLLSGATDRVRALLTRQVGIAPDRLLELSSLGLGSLARGLARLAPGAGYPPLRRRPVLPALVSGDPRGLDATLAEGSLILQYPEDSFDGVVGATRALLAGNGVTDVTFALENAEARSEFLDQVVHRAGDVKVRALVETRHHPGAAAWVDPLRAAGVSVVIPEGPYVHGKLLVQRRPAGGAVLLHTGNFHAGQASYLTDFAILSAHPGLVAEAGAALDAALEGRPGRSGTYLKVAPGGLRVALEETLAGARRIIVAGEELTDPRVAGLLVARARAGARVDVVVRSVAQVAPGRDLAVHSLVGRFLHHARFTVTEDRVLVGSADASPGHLDRHAHWAFALDRTVFPREHRFFWALAHLYLADTVNRSVKAPDGSWAPAAAPAARAVPGSPADRQPLDMHEALGQVDRASGIAGWFPAPGP